MAMMKEIAIKRDEYIAEFGPNVPIYVCTNCKDVVVALEMKCPKCGKEFDFKDLAQRYCLRLFLGGHAALLKEAVVVGCALV